MTDDLLLFECERIEVEGIGRIFLVELLQLIDTRRRHNVGFEDC